MRKIFIILLLLSVPGCSGSGGGGGNSFDPYDYPQEINVDEVKPAGNLFYADPVNGSMSNDGSSENPWRTLQEVVDYGLIETEDYKDKPYEEGGEMITVNKGAPVKSGDTIILRSGFHGKLEITGAFNKEYITIIAEDGSEPRFSSIHIRSAKKWKFSGLFISPEYASTYEAGPLIDLESHNWHGPVSKITIDNCSAHSVQDSSAWTKDNWNDLSCNGIMVNGESITLRNNYLKNVNFGISVDGRFALVKGNTIENFAGDGMRGIGNDMFFEYNTVKNCYAVNANHDDGFQSWSLKDQDQPPRERVILRGNTIINNIDPDQPFKGTLQGIGCFDGPFIDWVIENNLIVVDHWHGISLYEAHGCRIVNNTVVDVYDNDVGPSWIMITDHKDGTASSGCIIRNNISNSINTADGVSEDHNYIISESNYSGIFLSPEDFDFHLKAGASVIDTGKTKLSPPLDKDRKERINGDAVDIGAYEYY